VLHDEKGEGISPVVKAGRPQAGMPAFPSLSDAQIYDIAEYIHLQIELAANRGTYGTTYRKSEISGDAAKGKTFFAANCAGCHSVTGDLAHVGSKYAQPTALMNRIAWPTSPQTNMGTVTTASGEKISGRLVTYTDFEVAMRDSENVYHSWPRAQVQVNLPDRLAGHRALLPKYSDADLHNLTRFLGTLQ
jgi:cytochrome c553